MTSQTGELLVHRGLHWWLMDTPLDTHARALGVRFAAARTDLWRGYQASWAVRDGQLWLLTVDGVISIEDGSRRPVDHVVLGLSGLPAPATWVSGTLRAGRGRVVAQGYELDSRFETELELVVESGLVTRTRALAAVNGDPYGPAGRVIRLELDPVAGTLLRAGNDRAAQALGDPIDHHFLLYGPLATEVDALIEEWRRHDPASGDGPGWAPDAFEAFRGRWAALAARIRDHLGAAYHVVAEDPRATPRPIPILAFVRSHLGPDGAVDAAGDRLPDDALLPATWQHFATGAREGMIVFHASSGPGDRALAERLADALRALATDPGPASRRAVETAAVDGPLLSLQADLQELLRARPPYPLDVFTTELRRLLEESVHRGAVKIALILLADVGDASDLPALRDLARHEELTLWAQPGLARHAAAPRDELLALARAVRGWGRVHVVYRLLSSPGPEVCRFLLAEGGFRNDVTDGYTVIPVAKACRADEIAADPNADPSMVSGVLRLLGAAADETLGGSAAGDLYDWPEGVAAAEAVIERASVARSLEDLRAFEALLRFLDEVPDLEDVDADLDPAAPWAAARDRLRDRLEVVLADPHWADLAKARLERGGRDQRILAADVAQGLGLATPADWEVLVRQDPADGYAWFRFVAASGDAGLPAAAALAEDLLVTPEGTLRRRPSTSTDPTFDPVLSSVQRLVEGLRAHPGVAPGLVAAALTAQVSLQLAALSVLRAWDRSLWPAGVDALLVRATYEEHEGVAEQARLLLDTAGSG